MTKIEKEIETMKTFRNAFLDLKKAGYTICYEQATNTTILNNVEGFYYFKKENEESVVVEA